MENILSKMDFIKLGFKSGILVGGINIVVWLFIGAFESWGPSKSEVILSNAWSASIGLFFLMIIYSTILGFLKKYLQRNSRVIFGTFVAVAIISGILESVISQFSTFDFAIMVGFVIPLTIFYRGVKSNQWYNWIKIVALAIALLLIYEYITKNMFTYNRFQYFNSVIRIWVFGFLAYGPQLLITVYVYHKKLGKLYHIDEYIGRLKLKDFLIYFYKNQIEYTYHK